MKLNLGCGSDIKEGYVNIDSVNLKGVDLVLDLEKTPYPYEANSIDEIICKDVLEHLDYINVLKELHRILKTEKKIIITVPHFTSKHLFADPTHKHGFSCETFDYFTKEHKRNYYFGFSFSLIEKKMITFDKKWYLLYNYFIEIIININKYTQFLYEQTPLRMFPARNIKVVLIK